MDSWIPNTAFQPADSSKTRGKGKGAKSDSPQYPLLEAGQVTVATLQQHNGLLHWKTLTDKSDGRRLVVSEDITKKSLAFPATKSKSPPPHSTTVSLKQRAEQGAHFLRIYYPDVDIPSQLIRDQIIEEVQSRFMKGNFDPSRGPLIDVIYYDHGPQNRFAFVAFPMGETGSGLNISAVEFSQNGTITWRPANNPVKTFETPIRQVTAFSPLSSRPNMDKSILAIRTMSSVGIYEVDISLSRSARQACKVALNEISNFSRVHVGDRWISDVVMSPSLGQTVLLNDKGVIFRGSRGSFNLEESAGHENTSDDGFWRLSATIHDDVCLVTSSRSLSKVDFRSSAPRWPVYRPIQARDLLTSTECSRLDHTLRLVTTRQLLWLDERFEKRPVLAYKHHRQFDRALQTHTFEYRDKTFTFLSSLNNNLITVYDVSRGEDQLIQVGRQPYNMSFGSPDSHDGYQILRQPFEISQLHVPLLQLSSRGGILQTSLVLSPDDTIDAEARSKATLTTQWSQKTQDLDKAHQVMEPYSGSLGVREHHEVDLRPLYTKLLSSLSSDVTTTGGEVYNTLDKMPYFWQEMDTSSENMLTTFDIAFRSGDEPQHHSRADFLTRSSLEGVRGYRAFIQNRIPYDALRKQASWHYNIEAFLGRTIPDIPDDLHDLADRLNAFDLKDDDYRSGPSLRRETEAREQLALDLALSSDVFSDEYFGKRIRKDSPEGALDDMSRAAEAMSLEDAEPPAVEFGFFKPTPKADHYQAAADQTAKDAEETTQPPGVRLLLQEWDVGSNPEDYLFVDPYLGDLLDPSIPSRTSHSLMTGQGQASVSQALAAQSQQPPRIMAASQVIPSVLASLQPSAVGSLRVGGFSQDTGMYSLYRNPSLNLESQSLSQSNQPSQMPMASTQIVSGPFGGRQLIAKKKPVKKRVGGF